MALTPTQRQQAPSMGMNVDWAEELLSFLGSRPDLATFPMEYYTPEGANLSDTNFAETLTTAVAAAQEAGGGVVQIPAGTWNIGTSEFVIVSAGRDKPLYIEGAGINTTSLLVDEGYTGTVFHLTGLPGDGAADLYYYGGIANMTIGCGTVDVSTTGTGIKISSCINTQFLNLDIRNFLGGVGFRSTFTAPDFTNQYVQLYNVTCATNDTNFYLTSFVNGQGFGVFANDGATREFLCDDVKAAFFGGNFQSSAPVCFEMAGNGGCSISIHHFYYEGTAGTLFKASSPAISNNELAIYTFDQGAGPKIFLDAGQFNNVSVFAGNGIANSTTIYKGVNGPNV